MNIDLPKGVRAFSPEESFQIEYIKERIFSVIKLWGYERIILPQIEYFEVHRRGIGRELENRTFRLIDRAEGEIITLRADFTAQIARYVSSLRKKEFPMRFYYYGNLFRYVPPKADNLWERKQIGVELIGVDELEGDAEVITIASKVLDRLGIDKYQIDINNIKIFEGIRNVLSLSEDEYKRFMEFVKHREVYYLKEFVKDKVNDKVLSDFIVSIPEMQGDINLIKSLRKNLEKYNEIDLALKELEDLYRILSNYGISGRVVFDLGEPREFFYYTGVVFEIVLPDFYKPVGQGGRYDNLLSQYNGNYPATGFAFNLINLWNYLSQKKLIPEKMEKDFFIIDTTPDKEIAHKVADFLRQRGYSVARDIVERNYEDSIKYAFEKGFKNVIVIGIDRGSKDIYIYSMGGSIEKLPFEEFLKKFQ